jgi:hypothetical protein
MLWFYFVLDIINREFYDSTEALTAVTVGQLNIYPLFPGGGGIGPVSVPTPSSFYL